MAVRGRGEYVKNNKNSAKECSLRGGNECCAYWFVAGQLDQEYRNVERSINDLLSVEDKKAV
jgi:hypothetical protein